MKIQCEKCQAVYNVPDEKIKGRPIRFTCKRCGNIVRFRPEKTAKMTMEMSASDVESGMNGEMGVSQEEENAKTVFDQDKIAKAREEIAEAQSKAEPKPEESAKREPRMTIEGQPLAQQPVANQSPWYVAYSKNKRGPMSIEQIQQHLLEVDVKGEIYVWKSGFDSWRRIAEVVEFRSVCAALEAAKSGVAPQVVVPQNGASSPATEKPARPSFADLLKSELGDAEEKAPVSSQKIDISELMNTKDVKTEEADSKKAEPAKTKAPSPMVMEEYRPPEKKKFPFKAVLTLLFLLIVVIATPLTLAYKEIIEIPGLDKVPVIGVYFEKVEIDHYAKLRAQWEMLVKIDETKIAMQATKEEEEKQRIAAEKKKALEEKRARIKRAASRRRSGGGSAAANVTEFDFGDGADGTEMDTIGDLDTTNIKRVEALKQSQVNAVIRKNMGKIASCVKGQKQYGESVMGTMNVQFTISRRGGVVRANILTDKFKGTYVADCVAATIERLRFPKSGTSNTVSYPFKIK